MSPDSVPLSAPADPGIPTAPGTGEVLRPSAAVPAGVIVLGSACLALRPLWGGAPWLAGTVVLFGLFLLLQALLLRLEFNGDSLLVWRRATLIRRFPYAAWLGWRLFWPLLPVLFYFREERSIHLLPVLFDPAGLQRQLRQHLAACAPAAAPPG
jgi:hypothetical protein